MQESQKGSENSGKWRAPVWCLLVSESALFFPVVGQSVLNKSEAVHPLQTQANSRTP